MSAWDLDKESMLSTGGSRSTLRDHETYMKGARDEDKEGIR